MNIPLRVLSSNDAFAVLSELTDVIDGISALFVRQPIFDQTVSLHEVPSEVEPDLALIVESSGSTGRPKQIQIPREALIASATASLERLGEPGQWLLALPTHFIAGIQVLVRSILSDQQPILMNTSVPFTAEGFVRSASLMTASHRYTSLVPTQLDTLVAAIDTDASVLAALQRFDRILVGGQAPNRATLNLLSALGVRVTVTYGMTETCGGCVYDGVPLRGVEIELDDDGQIFVSGAMLAKGLGANFATADLGRFDEAGRLEVIGRSDRVINSGGIKLALDEVEAWLLRQPAIIATVAVPIEHEKFGQTFACWYTSDSDTSVESDQAVQDLGLPAKHATWRRVDRIPLLPNGKPDLLAIVQGERELRTPSDN